MEHATTLMTFHGLLDRLSDGQSHFSLSYPHKYWLWNEDINSKCNEERIWKNKIKKQHWNHSGSPPPRWTLPENSFTTLVCNYMYTYAYMCTHNTLPRISKLWDSSALVNDPDEPSYEAHACSHRRGGRDWHMFQTPDSTHPPPSTPLPLSLRPFFSPFIFFFPRCILQIRSAWEKTVLQVRFHVWRRLFGCIQRIWSSCETSSGEYVYT